MSVPLVWGEICSDPHDRCTRHGMVLFQEVHGLRGYLIAAPSVFRSGVEEVISVTIFNSPREVMVQAQLVAQGEAVAQTQGAILDKGTIKLKVPTGLRGQALLKVWGHGLRAEEGPLFHNQTSVTVDSRGASVFIQTDKPVYRPQHRGGRPVRAGGGESHGLELPHASLLSSSANQHPHRHPRPEAHQREAGSLRPGSQGLTDDGVETFRALVLRIQLGLLP
ncbi:hypothetical protein CB1_000172027 [Camelus ferus]|nr:hypothetical protein CB1_000172027 [Camelus ferus]